MSGRVTEAMKRELLAAWQSPDGLSASLPSPRGIRRRLENAGLLEHRAVALVYHDKYTGGPLALTSYRWFITTAGRSALSPKGRSG